MKRKICILTEAQISLLNSAAQFHFAGTMQEFEGNFGCDNKRQAAAKWNNLEAAVEVLTNAEELPENGFVLALSFAEGNVLHRAAENTIGGGYNDKPSDFCGTTQAAAAGSRALDKLKNKLSPYFSKRGK